jgi:pimeloyl-ACP methyl ester carboxylesterase
METTENTGYIDMDGDKVYYQTAGEGEPIVFLHAGFVDSRMWDEQWSAFSQRYRVIRFDMRGFGKSDRAKVPFTRRGDLCRVMKHLNIARAHLVGCSIGGEIILDFALEHPQMAATLVMVSAVPNGFGFQGEPPQYLLEMMAAIQQRDLALASELQMRIWIDGPFRQPYQVNRRVRAQAAEMNRTALANETMSMLDATSLNPSAISRLNEIRVPTLVIAGKLDNPEILRAADVMTTALPQARKMVISDSAHLPNMEQPHEFNQVVLDFLDKQKQPDNANEQPARG